MAALLAATMLCWLVVDADASAQRRGRARKVDGVRPEVHLSLGPGFGTGFQLEIPVYQKGWLRGRGVTDELVLSPGFEFIFHQFRGHGHHRRRDLGSHWHPAFGPFFVGRWNIYFERTRWSVFPEVGFTVMIARDYWLYHQHDHDHVYRVYFDPVFGFGARWHFSDRGALVMRLVYPFGFQFGVNF